MGPAAVQILPDVVREPDLFVLAPKDAAQATGVPIRARPVWVIEVLSPATRSMDLGEKAEDYAEAGIPEYWAVDPEHREVVIHRLQKARYRKRSVRKGLVRSRSLPGFWLRAEWLWQKPLPPVAICLREVLEG